MVDHNPAFVVNPDIDRDQVKDTICSKISQARALTEYLLANATELQTCYSPTRGMLMALDDHLEELMALYERFWQHND